MTPACQGGIITESGGLSGDGSINPTEMVGV
jgi:hypothetical protein